MMASSESELGATKASELLGPIRLQLQIWLQPIRLQLQIVSPTSEPRSNLQPAPQLPLLVVLQKSDEISNGVRYRCVRVQR